MRDVVVDPKLVASVGRLAATAADLGRRLAALPHGMLPSDPTSRAVLAAAIQGFQREAEVPGLEAVRDALLRPFRWRASSPERGFLASERGFDHLGEVLADARDHALRASDVEVYSVTTGWTLELPARRAGGDPAML